MMDQLRSIDAARLVSCVALEELDGLHTRDRHVVAVEGDVLFRLSWSACPRWRTLATGLVGYCRVAAMSAHPATKATLRLAAAYAGDVRVHFCGHTPCRARFDGLQVEAPVMHVVALGSLGSDADVALGALWKGVASVGVPGAPSGSQGSLVARSHLCASRLRVALPGESHQPATVNEAAVELSRDWRVMGASVGFLAFFVYAYLRQCIVHVHMFAGEGYDMVDVVDAYGPWAVSNATRLLSAPRHALACISVTDAATGTVTLRLSTPADVGLCNHFVPIVRRPGGAVVGPCAPAHPPCDGTMCGGQLRDPCMAQLAAELAPHGFLPLENVCQGDCAIAIMDSWDGGDKSPVAIKRVRHALADALVQRRAEARWQTALALAGEAVAIADGHSLPAPSGAPASIVPHDPAAVACELDAAVEWKLHMKKPPDHLVALVVDSLDDAGRAALVESHKDSLSVVLKTPSPARRKKRNAATRYRLRIANGDVVAAFFRERGIDPASELPRGAWASFRDHLGVTAVKWTKNDQMCWFRCLRECLEAERCPRGGREPVKYRKVTTQGRPTHATIVREQLFEWFCERRRSVKGRLPLRCLWDEATRLRDSYAIECIRQSKPCAAPQIGYKWLRAWCKEYGVSLRRPNQRWKVPRGVLKERLRVMWSNLLRVHTFLFMTFGYFAEIDGFDQKPMHVAESGSKLLQTLAFTGEADVTLEECHTATRDRWTLTTWVTNSLTRAMSIPPLECCFKGGVRVHAALQRMLADIRAGGLCGDWLSLVATEKGSYKEPDVYRYLERHMEPWGPTRRWRILFCDAYSAHDSHAIRKLAWARGYILMYHGGGSTGVVQVNDTDLHYFISQMYVQMEMLDLHERNELFTGRLATRSKPNMVTDVISIWKNTSLHLKARDGHLLNGLCERVDGADEPKMDRLARTFWEELDMESERKRIVADLMDEFGKAGLDKRYKWSYKSVRRMIQTFPKRGHLDTYKEGQEDEGGDEVDDAVGAPLWNDDVEPSDDDDDGAALQKRKREASPRSRVDASPHADASCGGGAPVPRKEPVAGVAWLERHTFKVARTNLLLESSVALGSRSVVRALRAERRRLTKLTEEWKANAPLVFAVREENRTREDTLRQDRKRARLLDREAALLKAREEDVRKKEKKAQRLRERVKAEAAAALMFEDGESDAATEESAMHEAPDGASETGAEDGEKLG